MKLIPLDALVAEIERLMDELYDKLPNASKVENGTITISETYITGKYTALESVRDYIDTLEVKEVDEKPNPRFPHHKDIVDKVFGAGNLESWEYSDAEMLVSLAKEELLKDIEVKEVDLDFQRFAKEMDDIFALPSFETKNTEEEPLNWEYAIAKHFFELGLSASNPIAEVDLESLVRQVIDLYLEAGKHYDSVIKEERKEYSGSDLAIKLLGGALDAKELGIQYVLDKLKAQKGKSYE